WDLTEGSFRALPALHEKDVRARVLGPDGELALWRDGGQLEVYDPAGRLAATSIPSFVKPDRLAFSPDGRWLAAAGERCCLVDLADPTSWPRPWEPEPWYGADLLAFSPDGTALYTARGWCDVHRVDVSTLESVALTSSPGLWTNLGDESMANTG